ncbi:hypothetical protein AG1IA_01557 [Rhizoctonia solani AG-1 IA]|uniref:Non-haem dioxygenase N-terminal domain-containing protein n=1 Tax=Thanatephorus cucumeris (strain AG1-IA) TaxID=983506 RepID=L8X275_THACA|nr:hypothetical protein AG1IA_01557 [Rhizoctonia solani AG-1 IA]
MSVTISTTINGSVPLPEPNTALPPDADTLPIIDVSSYIPNHPNNTPEARQQTAKALHAACRDFGFFYLNIASLIEEAQTNELAELGHQFFRLKQEVKDALHIQNQDLARGESRRHTRTWLILERLCLILSQGIRDWETDMHEGLDFYAPVAKPDKTKPLWGENQWPTDEDLPGFRSAYEKWIVQMKDMADGLGMTGEEWLDLRAKIDDSFWVMRVIGYPPLKDEADGISCGAHNLLFADPTPRALQVFRHAAKTENLEEAGPGSFGTVKSLTFEQIWTNGLYKSTIHRVVHRGTNFRVPFFFEPNFDALVEPLPAALRLPEVQGKAEERYQSVVYGEFLYKKVSNNFSLGKGRYD